MIGWLRKRIRTAQEGYRLSEESIDSAIVEIEQYGMKAHYYLAGVGNRESTNLSYALDILEAAGFIITDQDGQLVGKVATKNVGSSELAEQRRALLKIVK